MEWTEISSLIIIIFLASLCTSLMRQNSTLKKERLRLLKKTDEYEIIRNRAKQLLQNKEEIQTIKSLRKEFGLSLLDAKNIVDEVT